MRKKYIVFPGHVTSVNDGDRHFITGSALIALYGVDWRDCIIVNTGLEIRGLRGTFIELRPKRLAQNYDLKNCEEVTYE